MARPGGAWEANKTSSGRYMDSREQLFNGHSVVGTSNVNIAQRASASKLQIGTPPQLRRRLCNRRGLLTGHCLWGAPLVIAARSTSGRDGAGTKAGAR